MGLADRVAGRLEAVRSDPVSMQEFGYLLSGQGTKSKSGVSVGEQRALGLSSWWRGVRYLSETIAGLPVHTYRDVGGVRTRRADPPWLRRPDVEMPWFTLVEHWMMSELHRGNAHAFKLRNPVGQVVGLRALHPNRVKVGQAGDGTKMFQLDNRTDIGFTRREIFHVPGLSTNGVVGIDPLRAHAESLGIIAAADEYAGRFFGEGDHTRAYLQVEQSLTTEQADDLKVQWEQFHKGMANAHGFGVVGNGTEYKVVGLDAQQSQLLESRRFGVTEIARILGVVPHKLYDLERSTNNNIEHQAIEAVTDGIRPWVQRFEAFLNSDPDLLPAGNFVEFQLEGLLRGDSAARAAYFTAGVMGGWLQPASAARHENEPAPPELEYWLRPLNMAVVREGQPDQTPVEVPA